jgi:CheY-like chemotaxis protein
MPFPPNAPLMMAGQATPEPLPFRGITLFLVEDSRFTCDALRLICQRAGGRLRRAETIASARAHLACYRPDVVIVDLGLPDGRGEVLIAEVAAKGLPVLGISGDPDGRAAALAAGAAGFIDKPIGSISSFHQLILGLLGTSGVDTLTEPLPAADLLALRDDLIRAAALVAGRGADIAYAAGFVRSLARAAGDQVLERTALQAMTGTGQQALGLLLADRLAALGEPA